MSEINYCLNQTDQGHNRLRMLIDRFWGPGTYDASLDNFALGLYPSAESLEVLRESIDDQVPMLCLDSLTKVRRSAAAIGFRDRDISPDRVLPADATAHILRLYADDTYETLDELSNDETYPTEVRTAASDVHRSFDRVAEGGLLWGRHPSVHITLQAIKNPAQITVYTEYQNSKRQTRTFRESAVERLNGDGTAANLSDRELTGYREVMKWRAAQNIADEPVEEPPIQISEHMYDDLINSVRELQG